jgi:RHS repeat-associated protein
VGGVSFGYDGNGNRVSRSEGTATVGYSYDAENRLTVVSNSADPDDTAFVYDADGARIKRAHGDEATYYIGPIEIETNQGDVAEVRSIYSLGGGVSAVRVVASAGDDGEVTFTFGDHLGSSSTVWQAGDLGDTDPGVTSWQRYYPYGEPRDDYDSALPTDHTFTGQITDGLLGDGGTGLMYYGARYYDAQVGRFAAADTIIPNPGNPQDLNRYAYVSNNPVNGVDPSGHGPTENDWHRYYGHPTPEYGGEREKTLPDLGNPITVTGSLETRRWWHPASWFSHVVDGITGRDAGDYADYIVAAAQEAGVDPVLLFAIVEHESRNQSIWGLTDRYEDAAKEMVHEITGWLDPSIGMTQMTRSTFYETVDNHPDVFEEGTAWYDLRGDDLLAIRAAAYHLSDLQAQLETVVVHSPLDERYLLALGYGAGSAVMLQVAEGGALGPEGAKYVGYVAEHYSKAHDFFCGIGHDHGYTCS